MDFHSIDNNGFTAGFFYAIANYSEKLGSPAFVKDGCPVFDRKYSLNMELVIRIGHDAW